MAITKIQSESMNLADTYNFSGTVTGAGGVNTPAFRVFRSGSAQTVSNQTDTKIQFNSESFDTANAFDSSTNYRFTPQTAGKYFIYLNFGHNSGTEHNELKVKIFKNGTSVAVGVNWHHGYSKNYEVSTVVDLNGSTDYIEGYVFHNYGSDRSSEFDSTGTICYMMGYKIIE